MPISRGVHWYGEQVMGDIRKAAADGLLEAAEEYAGRAAQRAPHEEGTLERDVHTRVDPQALKAVISFGEGPASAYAVVQHEEKDYRHDPGRTYKFLENTVKEDPQLLQRHVAKRIREAHQ